MHAAQREFLKDRYEVNEWYGHTRSGRRVIKEFHIEGSELKGWKLHKMKHAQQEGAKVTRSVWSRGDDANELLAVDVFVCGSVKAAHETLLEVLSNMESGAIERKKEKNTPGDVAFGLANTVLVFARANVVALVRNAGPTIVPVGAIARELDGQIQQRLDSEK